MADLASLTHRQLIDLAKDLGGGKVGVDYARLPKGDLASFIGARYHGNTIRDGIIKLAAKGNEGTVQSALNQALAKNGNGMAKQAPKASDHMVIDENGTPVLAEKPTTETSSLNGLEWETSYEDHAPDKDANIPEGEGPETESPVEAALRGLEGVAAEMAASQATDGKGAQGEGAEGEGSGEGGGPCETCQGTQRVPGENEGDEDQECPDCAPPFTEQQEDRIREIANEEDEPDNEQAKALAGAFVQFAKASMDVEAGLDRSVRAAHDRIDKAAHSFQKLTQRVESLSALKVMEQAAQAPQNLTIVLPESEGGTQAKLDHVPHYAFAKILRLVRAGLNVMLVGPAGSGKTTIAEDIGKALARPYYAQSITAGTSEAAFIGRLLPLGEGGAWRYLSSPAICRIAGERVELDAHGMPTAVDDEGEAGVLLIDEMDAGDPNMLLVINSLLANGYMVIEQRMASGLGVQVNKHKRSVIIGACNTFGTGMDMLYAGRSVLDAAFLDRWYPVKIDYDPALEARIMGMPVPNIPAWTCAPPPEDAELRRLGQWVKDVREKATARGFRRVVGTRMIQKALAARRAGISSAEVKADLLSAWKADEIAAVMG